MKIDDPKITTIFCLPLYLLSKNIPYNKILESILNRTKALIEVLVQLIKASGGASLRPHGLMRSI